MKCCIRHQPWETICSQTSSLPSPNPQPAPQLVWVTCGWLGTRLLCPWALFQVTVGIWKCWGMGGPTEWWGWGASGTKDWQRAGGWSWKEQSLIHKGVHLYLPAPRRGSQAVTKRGDGFWRSERMRSLEQPSSFNGYGLLRRSSPMRWRRCNWRIGGCEHLCVTHLSFIKQHEIFLVSTLTGYLLHLLTPISPRSYFLITSCTFWQWGGKWTWMMCTCALSRRDSLMTAPGSSGSFWTLRDLSVTHHGVRCYGSWREREQELFWWKGFGSPPNCPNTCPLKFSVSLSYLIFLLLHILSLPPSLLL